MLSGLPLHAKSSGAGSRRVGFAVLATLLVALVIGSPASRAQEGPAVDSDPRSASPSTIAPQGAALAPVQFNEFVRLGLLMMVSKPPAPLAVAASAPANTAPWTRPYRTGPRGESPVVVPPPALGPGDAGVYAVGDSVLLGTNRWLGQVLGGWNMTMDAVVGRRFPEGIDVLRQNQNAIPQVVVIVLGHNYGGGGSSYGYIDDIIALTSRAQRVVFVTVTEWTNAQVEVNRAIYAAAARYPKIVVAPWAETIKANPQWLVDNVHPTTAGAIALANLIAMMVGPVPSKNGSAPPIILPIPDDTRPAITITSTTTTTTRPGGGTTTSTSSSSTTTSVPSSTTAVTPLPTTSTTTSLTTTTT